MQGRVVTECFGAVDEVPILVVCRGVIRVSQDDGPIGLGAISDPERGLLTNQLGEGVCDQVAAALSKTVADSPAASETQQTTEESPDEGQSGPSLVMFNCANDEELLLFNLTDKVIQTWREFPESTGASCKEPGIPAWQLDTTFENVVFPTCCNPEGSQLLLANHTGEIIDITALMPEPAFGRQYNAYEPYFFPDTGELLYFTEAPPASDGNPGVMAIDLSDRTHEWVASIHGQGTLCGKADLTSQDPRLVQACHRRTWLTSDLEFARIGIAGNNSESNYTAPTLNRTEAFVHDNAPENVTIDVSGTATCLSGGIFIERNVALCDERDGSYSIVFYDPSTMTLRGEVVIPPSDIDLETFILAPDGTTAFFTGNLASSTRLWSVPTDGSAQPTELYSFETGALGLVGYRDE